MADTQRKSVGFLQREIFLKHGSLWSPNFLLLWREITTWRAKNRESALRLPGKLPGSLPLCRQVAGTRSGTGGAGGLIRFYREIAGVGLVFPSGRHPFGYRRARDGHRAGLFDRAHHLFRECWGGGG